MQAFATTAPVSAVLDIPAGRIRVVAADRSDATVQVVPADASKSRDVKAAERIEVAFADGVLRVSAADAKSQVLGSSGAVEVTVQVPTGSRVEAKTASSEFRGAGRLGDVTFEGAQGSIQLEDVAGARLSLQSGDITVGRLGGGAEISTQQGDLTITEAVDGEVTLRTEKGNITVGAASESSASLDAGTSFGRVHNGLRNAAGAAANLKINATAAYGDITARSL